MNDKSELLSAISQRYRNAGFSVSDLSCTNGVVLQNAFSIQAVFVAANDAALKNEWAELHDELIQAYRSYEGFVDMEWNFYCVFVLVESGEPPGFQKLRRSIENDTTYSRKFVLLASELPLLPPGRVHDLRELESFSPDDPQEHWRSILGDELLDRISAATFAQMKEVLGALVRETAAHDD